MSFDKGVVRDLEVIAYEESRKCANDSEVTACRVKAFNYVNQLKGNDAYRRVAYIQKYISMVEEYKCGKPMSWWGMVE